MLQIRTFRWGSFLGLRFYHVQLDPDPGGGEESTVLLQACNENLRYHNSGLCLFESITKVPVSMEKSQIMNSVPASFINYCNNSVLVKTLFVLQVPEWGTCLS